MNNELSKLVASIDWNATGKTINDAGQFVFTTYARQAYNTGCVDIWIAVLLFIISAVLWTFAIPCIIDDAKNNEPNPTGSTILSVLGVLALVYSAVNFTSGILAMINPSYYALQGIAETIGRMK